MVRGQQLVLSAHNTHSTAAATGGRLQNQRIADTCGFARKLLLPFNDALAPGNGREPSRLDFPACAVLLTHHFDDFRLWADERDFRGLTHLGEVGIFRKEAVAGMNGIYIGNLCRADHLRNVEVALAAARRPDAYRLVGKANMERVTVCFGVNRDRGYPQFLAGADDPEGDLPAIRD